MTGHLVLNPTRDPEGIALLWDNIPLACSCFENNFKQVADKMSEDDNFDVGFLLVVGG